MTADQARRGLRFPLAWKLATALLATTALLLVVLLWVVGPRHRTGILLLGEQLVTAGAGAMRDIANSAVHEGNEVLTEVIAQSAESRRRLLADLPFELYGGDVARTRAALERHEGEAEGRLLANVSLLAREMERRANRRIDDHVAGITHAQQEMSRELAGDLTRWFALLAGGLLLVSAVALGLGLYRGVVLPLRELRVAVHRVAGGDLLVWRGARSRDEIGELSDDFAQMVEQLRASRATIDANNAELLGWNQRLEDEVEHKTSDLLLTQQRLADAARMAALGTLAGGVAHEFNNLIGGIRGCAREALTDERDPERRAALEVIQRAADRAVGITAQLLQYARARPQKRPDCDVARVVREAADLMEPDAHAAGVRMSLSLPDGMTAHGDPDALHQVFLNLLRNAVQAQPGGGEVVVVGSSRAGEVVVEVRDAGEGIAAGDLPRVFEPFFTTRDDLADASRRGSGLGLAVSHGIIAAHGGRIEVRSEPGRGATFTVTLPAGADEEAAHG